MFVIGRFAMALFLFGFSCTGEPLDDGKFRFFCFLRHRLQATPDSMSDATLEASEVLHTLMPIERIEYKKCAAKQEIVEKPFRAVISSDVGIDDAPEVIPWQTGTENVFSNFISISDKRKYVSGG